MPKIVKIKRSNVAGSTPVLSYGELGWNSADGRLYAGNAANQAVLVTTPSGGGGGGTTELFEADTTAGFPATGSPGVLYISRDYNRIYRWTDASAVYVELGTVGGGGSGSGTDDALRALLVPWAPTGVTASAGNAQAVVSWTAPSFSALPITDYVVQYSINSGTSWTTFSDGTSTATSATVTGLTNDTAYTFRVAAVNSIGTGAYSAASSAVTPQGLFFRSVPTMTGYSAPSGEVSVDQINASYPGWQAFDDNPNTWAYFDGRPATLQYAFPAGQKSWISGYEITSSNFSGGLAQNWDFFGSDDGASWTLLDSETSDFYWNGSLTPYYLASKANYRMYKWVFTGMGGPTIVRMQLLA